MSQVLADDSTLGYEDMSNMQVGAQADVSQLDTLAASTCSGCGASDAPSLTQVVYRCTCQQGFGTGSPLLSAPLSLALPACAAALVRSDPGGERHPHY